MEELTISGQDKESKYAELIPQLEALIDGEPNVIANMANISAALKATFNWLWVGFYLRDGDELVLGPFQGPIACTRIKIGNGVCGTVAESQEALIVPNVDEFPGHISCSAYSKSEIVLPIIKEEKTFAVLDIDSDQLDTFNKQDQRYLKKILALLH